MVRELTGDVLDAASGIALLYLGSLNPGDEYSQRLIAAMKRADLDEVEHVTALMVCLLRVRGGSEMVLERANEAWHRIWLENDRRVAT